MSAFDLKKKVAEDPKFIALKRFDYLIDNLIERYPEGCPDRIIAEALLISEPEVEEIYQKAVVKLRHIMGVEVEGQCQCEQNDPYCVNCYGH
jgi:hypothetical protein